MAEDGTSPDRKSKKLNDVHERAIKRFDEIQTAVRDERMQCLADRRFYSISGAQWEGDLGDQFANKPRFEMNKVHLAVIRIINEYRNNRITVDFTPKDGSSNDKLADACDGLYRADEQACTANEAYDNAFEEAVGGGFGAWRLRACYEDEDDDENEQQTIRIEPIFDADSCVFFDLNAKRQDKADAKFCFVLSSMTHAAYEEEYGEDPSDWPKDIQQSHFDWATSDYVYVAEYYEVEEKTEVVHIWKDISGREEKFTDEDLTPQKLDVLRATGSKEVRKKRVKANRIHKYQLSGAGVLEDEGIIAGRCIPIIPVFGKRWVVDNVERCMGHVRLAKDAQRLTNMLLSWLGESAARFDVEKPIFTPEQMLGHDKMWANDNVERYAYLLVNSITDEEGKPMPAGPIGYTKAPAIPQAMAALMQISEQGLQDLLGNQQQGEELQPNMSGKAVELVQNRLDMQTFIYMSNLAKAMKRSGEVWLSMKKDIVVEESRKMKVVSADGEPGTIVINEPAYDEKTGETYVANELGKANLEVVVDVGPSSASQRAATVRALTGLATITQDPETQQALTVASIANVEGEGLDGLRDWGRKKGIRIGSVIPTDEEKEELAQEQANVQPDPNALYLQSAAGEKDASRELKLAQTEKTLAETRGELQDQQIGGVEAVQRVMNPQPPTPPAQPTARPSIA